MALSLLLPSLLGLVALALAMDRHHEALPGRWRGRFARRVLRVVGIASLGASLASVVGEVGGSQGLLLWLGMLTPSGIAVVGLLASVHTLSKGRSTHRSRIRRPLLALLPERWRPHCWRSTPEAGVDRVKMR